MNPLSVEVVSWAAKDSELEVRVQSKPFGWSATYCRRREDGQSLWKWFAYSIAEKYTAWVSQDAQVMLDELVRHHPVLNRLLDQYGWRNPSDE